jgi:two-component system, NtrC family, sensor kinase
MVLASELLQTPQVQIAGMVLAVLAVGVVAYLDEERESRAALDDFAREQTTLAESLAGSLLIEDVVPGEGSAGPRAALARVADRMALPGTRMVMFLPPGGTELRLASGQRVVSPSIMAALAEGRPVARLERPEAEELGLHRRTALAGLARIEGGAMDQWSVAVVTTAERERDREKRARWRLLLAVAMAAVLVAGFGGWAFRRQRKALELSRMLAVAQVERERDERLEKLNKAAVMLTFASGLAHEVATPLAVIAGRAEQIQARLPDDDRSRAGIAVIVEQVQRIHQVIRGFLDLARGGTVAPEAVQPRALVESARALVAHRFAKSRVGLELACDASQPIRCNPTLVEHALVNLLLNACDACREGGKVRLEVAVAGGEIGFTVTDDGEGIPPEVAARVPEPFFTTKPVGAGTGLGLAIASEIAKSHRGSLALAPAAPRGTHATLRFPTA